MTFKQAQIKALEILKQKKLPTAFLDSQILLCFVLKKSKEYLFTYPQKKLTLQQQKKFQNLIQKRLLGEPVAYLTNQKEFYNLDFHVTRQVLIPRPRSEALVTQSLKLCQKNSSIKTLAEIGTGAGAIIISLAKNLPQKKIFATDICRHALKIAQKNAQTHQVKIKFLVGDLLTPLKNKPVDLLIANLPYVNKNKQNQKPTAQTIGLKFEPAKALYAQNQGLFFYQKLFTQLKNSPNLPQFVIIELEEDQKKPLQKFIKKIFLPQKIKILSKKQGFEGMMQISF